MALIVRDYVKWDDEPASLPAFAESAVRAYKIAMTPPMGPVLLVVDHDMQLRPMSAAPKIPRLVMPSPPAGETGAVREAARLLVAAENPAHQRRTRGAHAERHRRCSSSSRSCCRRRSTAAAIG